MLDAILEDMDVRDPVADTMSKTSMAQSPGLMNAID